MMNPSTAQALAAARLADMRREAARSRTRRWARAVRAERAAEAQTSAATLIPAQPEGLPEQVSVPDEKTLCLSGAPESALR
jgi:hypothetical protein